MATGDPAMRFCRQYRSHRSL